MTGKKIPIHARQHRSRIRVQDVAGYHEAPDRGKTVPTKPVRRGQAVRYVNDHVSIVFAQVPRRFLGLQSVEQDRFRMRLQKMVDTSGWLSSVEPLVIADRLAGDDVIRRPARRGKTSRRFDG